MEAFLHSTTAHGLANLVGPSRFRKICWTLGCLGAYGALVMTIITLRSAFQDPNNINTVVTVDTVAPKKGVNKTWILPDTYPRFIFCAKNPRLNLQQYEKIIIEHRMSSEGIMSSKLPPLQPMSLESNGFKYKPFNGFGMCTKLPVDATNVVLHWNGAKDPLLLFFAIDPRESYIKQTTGSGETMTTELSPRVEKVIVAFSRINLFELYTGPGSRFTNVFPPTMETAVGAHATYRRERCFDSLFVGKIPANLLCKKRYADLLRTVNESNDGPWSNLSGHGCSWKRSDIYFRQFYAINCHCQGKTFQAFEIEEKNDHICKQDSFYVEFLVSIEKSTRSRRGLRNGRTRINLKSRPIKIVTTTQSHAMTLTALFSQVGGFLGLLVGVSLITLLEFIEFFSLGVYRGLKAYYLS